MKVTTVRFGSDLWALLEGEAERDGVSVSQYIREAALTRATAAVAARGDDPFERLADTLGELAADHPDTALRGVAHDLVVALTRAADARASTRAVAAQSRQARRTARRRQERAAELMREIAQLLDRDR